MLAAQHLQLYCSLSCADNHFNHNSWRNFMGTPWYLERSPFWTSPAPPRKISKLTSLVLSFLWDVSYIILIGEHFTSSTGVLHNILFSTHLKTSNSLPSFLIKPYAVSTDSPCQLNYEKGRRTKYVCYNCDEYQLPFPWVCLQNHWSSQKKLFFSPR